MSDLRVPDLNHIFIAGRLTRDPEMRYLQSGMAVCKLAVANTRYFKGKNGERREDTCFVDVTLWDKQAEWCGQRLKKGRPVLVEGRLKMDTWEDKTTGQQRSRLEIQAQRVTPLDWDEKEGEQGQGAGGQQQRQQATHRRPQQQDYTQRPPHQYSEQQRSAPPIEPIPQDDIPF